MGARCPRLWEVEASLDGRLLPDAAELFAQHVAMCADCKQEQAGLLRLAHVCEESEQPSVDPLLLRRLRARTLEAASQAAHGTGEPRRRTASPVSSMPPASRSAPRA